MIKDLSVIRREVEEHFERCMHTHEARQHTLLTYLDQIAQYQGVFISHLLSHTLSFIPPLTSHLSPLTSHTHPLYHNLIVFEGFPSASLILSPFTLFTILSLSCHPSLLTHPSFCRDHWRSKSAWTREVICWMLLTLRSANASFKSWVVLSVLQVYLFSYSSSSFYPPLLSCSLALLLSGSPAPLRPPPLRPSASPPLRPSSPLPLLPSSPPPFLPCFFPLIIS